MAFWISSALMVVLAMGFVCFPLFRSQLSSTSELDSEQTFYQARLSEIEKDLELGRLDEVSADAAKAEEARRLIKTSETSKIVSMSRGNKSIVILAALSLPLFTIPFYNSVRSPQITSPSELQSNNSGELSMKQLLEIAEKRLKSNPDDVNGWTAIAPVYVRIGRFKDAIAAYENILRVKGRSPENIIKLADVYITQSKGQVNEKAKALISEVLTIDPSNPIAKFYTGIIALQNDDEDETIRIWQSIVDSAAGNEDWLPLVKSRISELKTSEPLASLPALDQDTIKFAKEMKPQERIKMIGEMVSRLAKRLEENPDDKEGWERLIRSYIVLERADDAKAAVQKASTQYANDAVYLEYLNSIFDAQKTSSNGEDQ